jgi:hypothetical protein
MDIARKALLAVCALGALGLAACSDTRMGRGLNPVLDAGSVQQAASNQAAIIDALTTDAGFSPGGRVDYYTVSEAGFNYVDDQCNAYFDTLFYLDRTRSQAKSGLAAAGATTAAILGLTNASTMSLSIVAAAFGFASTATDIVAGTYLYALPPATTQGLVVKTQTAFREAAAVNRAKIDSPSAAYYMVQRYLSLCLPPTIEAEVTKQVDAAIAIGLPANRGSLVTVKTGSSLEIVRPAFVGPAPITKEQVVAVRPAGPSAPVSKPPAVSVKDVQRSYVRQVQAALCVPRADRHDGDLNATTILAIKSYLGAMAITPPAEINPLAPDLQPVLQKAIDAVPDCATKGFANAFEVGAYGVASDPASVIKDVQDRINAKLRKKGSSTTIEETGVFDEKTRNAIEELRGLANMPPLNGEMSKDFEHFLFSNN